jgi:hypothetical protein
MIGGVAVGAVSAGGIQTMLPQTASMFDAVRALGGNPGSIKIGEINPLKAYQEVKRQITSGSLGAPFNLGTPVTVTAPSQLGRLNLNNNFHIDDAAIRRAVGAGINAQIQQSLRRSQDISAYARNPMGWHGAPPH